MIDAKKANVFFETDLEAGQNLKTGLEFKQKCPKTIPVLLGSYGNNQQQCNLKVIGSKMKIATK